MGPIGLSIAPRRRWSGLITRGWGAPRSPPRPIACSPEAPTPEGPSRLGGCRCSHSDPQVKAGPGATIGPPRGGAASSSWSVPTTAPSEGPTRYPHGCQPPGLAGLASAAGTRAESRSPGVLSAARSVGSTGVMACPGHCQRRPSRSSRWVRAHSIRAPAGSRGPGGGQPPNRCAAECARPARRFT